MLFNNMDMVKEDSLVFIKQILPAHSRSQIDKLVNHKNLFDNKTFGEELGRACSEHINPENSRRKIK